MGSWTPNYNLYKPAPHEQYWGEAVNENFDKLDNAIQETGSFDPTVELRSNLVKIGNTAVAVGAGTINAGTLRVNLATDDTLISNIKTSVDTLKDTLLIIADSSTEQGLKVTLRDSHDSEIGVTSNPLKVSCSDSAGLNVALKTIGTTVIDSGAGSATLGTIRATIATNDVVSQNLVKVGSIIENGHIGVSLQDSTGNEIGTDTAPIYFTTGNSPISTATNITKLNGTTIDVNAGNNTAGTLRVAISNDDYNLALINTKLASIKTAVEKSDDIQDCIKTAGTSSQKSVLMGADFGGTQKYLKCDTDGSVAVISGATPISIVLKDGSNNTLGTTIDHPLYIHDTKLPAFSQMFEFSAQHLGLSNIDLPFSAKSDENTATASTSKFILTRNLVASDLTDVVSYKEVTVTATSETTVIHAQRFFLDEGLNETLNLTGTFYADVVLDYKCSDSGGSSDGAGFHYIDTVSSTLKVLTNDDTYTTVADKVLTVNKSVQDKDYNTVSLRLPLILAAPVSVSPSARLVLEISTTGHKTVEGDSAIIRLMFSPNSHKTGITISC